MAPVAERTLTYSSVSNGSADRNQMREAWGKVYRGCRVALHEIFDIIRPAVDAYQRTGETVVLVWAGSSISPEPRAYEKTDAVVIGLAGDKRKDALKVMADDDARQFTANWLLPEGYTLGYAEDLNAVVVLAPT